MNYRERFLNTLLFKETNQVPFHEIAAWDQTIVRWRNEGAPEEALKSNGWFLEGDNYFGFEPRDFISIKSTKPMPEYESKVISEDERIVIYSDSNGVTHKALKEGIVGNTRMSMDQYMAFPVTDRKSFKDLKKRFTVDVDSRYSNDWDKKVSIWNNCNYPICLSENGDFGFYSILRTFMGTEGVSYLFYDDPNLAHDMLDFFCDYIIEVT